MDLVGEGQLEEITSRREQAKGERRARILEAAHDLLRQVGMEDVTVTAIATRAGLSPGTVYNLFGSKGAILARVFDLDLLDFEARLAEAASADGLDRLFDAIAIACQLYRQDPNFYRLTMVARGTPGQRSGLETAIREPRMLFWRRLVREAITDGGLVPDADAEAVSVLLVQIFAGGLTDWTSDAISIEQLEDEMTFGFAAVLASFAARPAQAKLRARLKRSRRGRATQPRAA